MILWSFYFDKVFFSFFRFRLYLVRESLFTTCPEHEPQTKQAFQLIDQLNGK